MADIDAVFKDDDFFTEIDKPTTSTNKPQWTPIADGEYYGHITDVTTREVNTHKGKHKAIVFNYSIEVADENAGQTYTYKWGRDELTAKGTEYIGKKIRACGVFRYIVAKDGDGFESNPDGNKSYGYFCQALGIELPTVEKEIDGQKVKVKSLPTITVEGITGMPVIGVVGKGRAYTNKNGKEVTPSEVKFVKTWSGGVKKDDADAEIPF
jgi:hypothetical protein|tara:strand:+ start:493 stop:1122 length:630 start_codon:yes stop_codon:yes gene_type:complete